MTQIQLVGGPLDGRELSVSRRSSFLWVDTRTPYAHGEKPNPYRVLYRRALVRCGTRAKVTTDAYVFAGYTHALCPGCGAYHERVNGHVGHCSLCGGALAKP